MNKSILQAMSITSLAIVALPAQAGTGSPAVVVRNATADPAAKPAADRQYCVRATMTGSRMAQKVCRTRKAWLAEGFDPVAPKN